MSIVLRKIMLAILALQILNLSICNADLYGNRTDPRTTTQQELEKMNPVDCLSELVVEDMLGVQDVFPETTSKTTKQRGELKHNIGFKIFQEDRFAKVEPETQQHYTEYKKDFSLFQNKYSYLFFEEINHPPA